MQTLTSIVALNEQCAIGVQNRMPWRVRSDLRFFRAQTENNVVIMGRRTFDSLGKSLPDRKNIVVTHGFSMFQASDECRAVGSIVEALVLAERWRSRRQAVFVVGGASMYEQFAPYVDRYLITEIEKPVPDADTFFDRSLIEPIDDWAFQAILAGQPKADFDEAGFSIYEFIKRDPSDKQAARRLAIENYNQKRSNNSLAGEWRMSAVA